MNDTIYRFLEWFFKDVRSGGGVGGWYAKELDGHGKTNPLFGWWFFALVFIPLVFMLILGLL